MVSLTKFNHFSLQKKASWWKNIQLKYLFIRNDDTLGKWHADVGKMSRPTWHSRRCEICTRSPAKVCKQLEVKMLACRDYMETYGNYILFDGYASNLCAWQILPNVSVLVNQRIGPLVLTHPYRLPWEKSWLIKVLIPWYGIPEGSRLLPAAFTARCTSASCAWNANSMCTFEANTMEEPKNPNFLILCGSTRYTSLELHN